MLLAIAIALIQQIGFFFYVSESHFFTKGVSERTHVLILAIALFTTLLSVPSLFWNINMAKQLQKKKNYVSTAIAVATLVFGIGFVLFFYVSRIHAGGNYVFSPRTI